jgi:Asp-tRNA(Asn)/Glu-tRNA(Gln) amidotransferase A subunit family amidase
VPVSIKDNLATDRIRTTMGSRLLQDWIPDFDAVVVEPIRAAGAVILGKTNTSEFGWKADAGNLLIGPTFNPWRLERTSGGSSGGAAAAVASGLCPIALGTDGAGSLRIPAAFCGVVGYKPAQGTVPVYSNSGIGTLSHHGPLARTVEDVSLVLQAVAGPDARDRLSAPIANRTTAVSRSCASRSARHSATRASSRTYERLSRTRSAHSPSWVAMSRRSILASTILMKRFGSSCWRPMPPSTRPIWTPFAA